MDMSTSTHVHATVLSTWFTTFNEENGLASTKKCA